MSDQRKPVMSIDVFEMGANSEGEMNYEVRASVRMGGVRLEFEKTTDEIRKYFTEKKERSELKKKKEGGELKMVSKPSGKN